MIDSFSLLLSHSLLLLMMWRLLSRDDIDYELPVSEERQRAEAERGEGDTVEAPTGWLQSRRGGGDQRNAGRADTRQDKPRRGWRDA